VILGGLFAAGRVPLARIFTSDLGVVAELGPFMLVLALAQPFMGLHFTLGGALRGAGDTVTPLVAATVGNWALRVPVAFLCAAVLATDVIWLWCALVLDHLARALWLLWAFQRGRWQERLGT
jgi:Na+-driven multidrug efflux pump